MKNKTGTPATTNVFTSVDETGKEVLTSEVFETIANEGAAASSRTDTGRPVFHLTQEELKAVTRDDIIYQAVAQIAIRKGLWVVTDPRTGGTA